MEPLSKNMDFLTKHWDPFQRRHPSAFRLASMDFIPAKKDWVDRTFETCNFSLILRGRGEFHRHHRVWPVQAPCVITQWPGERVTYGPVAGETWSELYLVYNRTFFKRFQGARLVNPEMPVWPVADPASLKVQVAELAALSRHPHPEAIVDRVDRVAERVLLETWLSPQAHTSENAAIHSIARDLRNRLDGSPDMERLVAAHGLSSTTFRRRWSAVIASPPARYLQELRMCEACRLLVETGMRIREIAAAVGFEDEFYFSRRFRRSTGFSPRDYRKTYHLRR